MYRDREWNDDEESCEQHCEADCVRPERISYRLVIAEETSPHRLYSDVQQRYQHLHCNQHHHHSITWRKQKQLPPKSSLSEKYNQNTCSRLHSAYV